MRRDGLAACVVALLLLPAAAVAEQWYERYERGLELERQGRWTQALEQFHGAARDNPRPGRRVNTYGRNFLFDYDPYFHVASCLVELDRPGEAVVPLGRARRAGVTPAPKLDELHRRIAQAVAGKVGRARLAERATEPPAIGPSRLSVTSAPPGAWVDVDGTGAGATPLPSLEVTPGQHTVRVSAAGYRPVERLVTVAAGTTYDLAVELVAAPAATAPPVPTAAATTPRAPATAAAATPTPAVRLAAVLPTPGPPPTAGPAPTSAGPPAPVAGFTPITVEPSGNTRRGAGLAVVIAVVAVLAALAVRRRGRRRAASRATPTATRAATAPTRLDAVPTTRVDRTATGGAGAPSGRYEVVSTLGRGGMATTFRARRRADGRTVALKVPHESCLAEDTFVTRFLREGALGEQLHHPNIVRILESGEEGGRPYLAMELLEGRTLKQVMREEGPLPPRRALEVARAIAEALDYAHAKGVVHRDLKPDNIMVLPDGALKVMDFGIARRTGQEGLTSTNLFLGTPLYAAPEMVDPKHIDHRVDLYALGIVLYEMLEGAVPFNADSPYRVIEMHLRQPLPRLDALSRPVPAPVWAVVERLCAKEREQRYPTAEALLVDLARVLRDLPE